MRANIMLEVSRFAGKREEKREQGNAASPNKGGEVLRLSPSPFTLHSSPFVLTALLVLLCATPASAAEINYPDLPPLVQVNEALNNHINVLTAETGIKIEQGNQQKCPGHANREGRQQQGQVGSQKGN